MNEPPRAPLPGPGDLALAGLILSGLAALWLVSGDRAPILIPWAVAALVAIVWPRPGPRITRGMTWLYIALPFVVVARALPVTLRGLDMSLSYYVSLFLLTIGLQALAAGGGRTGAPAPAWRRPRVLLASALAVASVGTDVDRAPYAWVVSGFAVCLVLALAGRGRVTGRPAPRASRLALDVAVALLALWMSYLGVRWIDWAWDDINRAFYKLVKNQRILAPGGFSGRADLQDIAELQANAGQTIAVRVYARSAPGYLRGRVFLTYAGGSWSGARPALPDGEPRPTGDGRYQLAGRAAPRAGEEPALQVFPVARYGATLFLPLAATRVDDLGPELIAWPGEALGGRGWSSARGYRASVDARPGFAEAADPAWRELPEDPAVIAAIDHRLARMGLAPAPPGGPPTLDVDAARQALVAHFATYTYHVGIRFRPGEDPIAQWLVEGTQGHCELFAAAGTLLLRRLGLAARYTTGFVVGEKNPLDDVWVARNKDAHAWIEVLHPTRGWETLELTPASGVPSATPPSGLQAFTEWLGGLADRIKGWFGRLDVQSVLIAVLGAIAGAFNWLIGAWWRIALTLLAVAYTLWRRVRRRAGAGPPERALSPALLAERDRVRALERALARRGLARGAGETLLEWADRLEAAPDLPGGRDAALALVRGYAARRYAPEPVAVET